MGVELAKLDHLAAARADEAVAGAAVLGQLGAAVVVAGLHLVHPRQVTVQVANLLEKLQAILAKNPPMDLKYFIIWM